MTDHYLSLGLGVSHPYLYNHPGFGNPFGLEQNNFQVDFELGYYGRLLGADRSADFSGGPTLTTRFSYMGSGIEALGSHRVLPVLSAGWLQHFSLFYVQPSVGAEIGINHINFGRGAPPLSELSLNLRFTLELGMNLCLGKATCPALFVSYQYGSAVSGNPEHASEALVFGLRTFIDVDPVVRLPHPENNRDAILYRATPSEPERIYVPLETAYPTPPVPAPPPPGDSLDLLGEHALGSPLYFNRRQSRLPLVSEWLNQRNARGRMQRVRHVYHPQLDAIVNYLQAHQALGVRLQGYANEMPGDPENRMLAYRRMLEVKNYLVQHGVSAAQIQFDVSLLTERRGRRDIILDADGRDIYGNRNLLDTVHPENPLNHSVRMEAIRGEPR